MEYQWEVITIFCIMFCKCLYLSTHFSNKNTDSWSETEMTVTAYLLSSPWADQDTNFLNNITREETHILCHINKIVNFNFDMSKRKAVLKTVFEFEGYWPSWIKQWLRKLKKSVKQTDRFFYTIMHQYTDPCWQYLAWHCVMTLRHELYPLDLACASIYLFQQYKDDKDIIANMMKHLKHVSKTMFQECFKNFMNVDKSV